MKPSTPPDIDRLVRVLQILYLAMASAIVTILAAFLVIRSPGSETTSAPIARILTATHGAMLLSSLPVAVILFGKGMARARAAEDPALAIQRAQAAYIIRLALVEGLALFGLVTLFVIGRETLAAQPMYWINSVSLVLYFALLSTTFPTRERIEYQLRSA